MPAITIENLSKHYNLGQIGYGSLYKDLQSWLAKVQGRQDPNKKIDVTGRIENRTPDDQGRFWALRDINLKIETGEVVGFIGRNGAGKSTLLKIITRITAPSVGTVRIRGRVASLLEVGTGFHPELTGRENVFLNGAILGMRHAEVRKKLDAIVDFSGIEQHIDTPVKRYSSGMYVRLAFAVAAHLEADILLVDEVLAVGDADFQKKCIGRMGDATRQGRTVLFVSHNLPVMESLCSRIVWIEKGQVAEDNLPDVAVNAYMHAAGQGALFDGASHHLEVTRVRLLDENNVETRVFIPGSSLTVELSIRVKQMLRKPNFKLSIIDRDSVVLSANMQLDERARDMPEGETILRCVFESLPLLPRDYVVALSVKTNDRQGLYLRGGEMASFSVQADIGALGLTDRYVNTLYPILLPYRWEFADGTVSRVALEKTL